MRVCMHGNSIGLFIIRSHPSISSVSSLPLWETLIKLGLEEATRTARKRTIAVGF